MGETGAQAISVTCGANRQRVDGLVGKTIAEVRQTLRDVLNIPDDAHASVSGDLAGPTAVVRSGDTIEFIRHSGEKGSEAQ